MGLVCVEGVYIRLTRPKYKLSPPTGSVLETFLRLWFRAQKMTGWFKKPNWDFVRPSKVPITERYVHGLMCWEVQHLANTHSGRVG